MIRFTWHVLFLFAFTTVQGQNDVPVDMHTGTPSVFIPLHTVSGHGLSDVIGVSYNARGLKLEESVGQRCGVGWRFVGGNSVTREVRGLPDDVTGGGGTDNRQGWLYGTIATDISNFSTTVDTLTSTCADENSVNTTLAGYNYIKDTEPDIFHYSVGGISGSFVFDNALTIRLIPFQDIKIEITQIAPPTDKRISSFKITTNDGVTYLFDHTVYTTKSTHRMNGGVVPEYQKREFEYYDNTDYFSGLSYCSEWMLTRVDSPLGGYLKYGYQSVSYSSSDTTWLGIRKLTSSQLVNKGEYRTQLSSSRRNLKYIASSAGDSLVAVGDPVDTVRVYDNRRNPAYVKEFVFAYQNLGSLTANTQRVFLKSITEKSQTEQIPPHVFTYINVDFVNNTCELPTIYSHKKDFWGYYNGRPNTHSYPQLYVYPSEPLSERFRLYPIPGYAGTQYTLPGADRTPEASKMQIGSLESIKYPTGGVATFNYEPNDYYDPRTAQNLIGGGLRIKSITYFDGVNNQAKIVKNFEYKDGANSSGRLVTRPTFAIPIKEYRDPEGATVKTYSSITTTQDKYEYLTIRSNRDLTQSFDSDAVGYRKVKVSLPGSGSTEYEFYMPAVYGNGTSGQWIATDNKFVRPNSCTSMDIVANGGRWAYSFSPNPNFGYERGFMLKRTDKNEAGVKVRESVFTPQYIYKSGSVPVKVWGVAYDYFANSSNVYFYGKYFLLTDVAKVLSIESVTTYDVADQAKNATTSTQYFFESTYHKLLTRSVFTSAEGSLVTTRMKYPQDYSNIPGTFTIDESLECLKTLKGRNSTPIEVTTSLTRSGESEKLVSASLTKFSSFGVAGKALPYEQLSLKIDQGITDFVASDKTLVDVNTYEFTYDTRYQVDATFHVYDTYGMLQSSEGNNYIESTTLWGFKKSVPVAKISDALPSRIAFSNFEANANTGREFTPSAQNYGTGRTGLRALRADQTLTSPTITKSGSNYKLTFWLKKGTGAVDITVKLKQTNGTLISTTPFNVNPATTNFERVEKLISVASTPASFIVEVSGNSSTAYIDDVAFYPENADISTYTYTFPFGASTITDSAGTTIFVEHDSLGRERLVRDQDGNIIRRTTYTFPSN